MEFIIAFVLAIIMLLSGGFQYDEMAPKTPRLLIRSVQQFFNPDMERQYSFQIGPINVGFSARPSQLADVYKEKLGAMKDTLKKDLHEVPEEVGVGPREDIQEALQLLEEGKVVRFFDCENCPGEGASLTNMHRP